MDKKLIMSSLDKILHERLFSAIKKLNINEKKLRFEKSADFINSESNNKKDMLDLKYKSWYKSADTFYLSLYSIFALVPLVKRELEIIRFSTEEKTVIRVDYTYDNIDFTASFPTRFLSSMVKEIEDCKNELKDSRYTHIIDNYKPVKDTEYSPHEPLTNASMKYSSFYLFQFDYKYTTELAELLFQAELITDYNTNGWGINDDVVEDIITVLNSIYDDSIDNAKQITLQYKRVFESNSSDRSQECIRPLNFSFNYFPENLFRTEEFKNINFENNRIKEDTIKLYEFIFDITISTQLKNSIYDTSSVDIVVGPNKLTQKAHNVIDNQENWELRSGKYIKTIHQNDNTEKGQSKTIVLPEFKTGDELIPLNVYSYEYNSQRPPRYGIGRFASQILESNNIGTTLEHDGIIDNLINSKAVNQIKKILHPQDLAIFLIEWLKEFCPSLIDLEYLKELNEKIELTINGDLQLESLEDELNRLIDEAFKKANYSEDTGTPSQAKINLINAISLKHRLNLDPEIYKSNVKCDLLLAQYPIAEPVKIGSCPACNAVVFQKEFTNINNGETNVYFACEKFKKLDEGCTFSIWDNKIESFFQKNGINLYTVEERMEALKKIIPRKRGYLFSNLLNESKQNYNAKIALQSFIPKDSKDNKTIWFLKIMKKEKPSSLNPIKNDNTSNTIVQDNQNTNTVNNKIKIIKPIKKKPIENINTNITNNSHLLEEIEKLKQENKKLENNGLKDYLTGAYNRTALDGDLELFWNKKLNASISLAFIDLDSFKAVNDTYGHDAGDLILKELVNRFKSITEGLKARVYKFGGDEFCIVFREPHELVIATLESIRSNIHSNAVIYNNTAINTSISVGLALSNIEYKTWKELLLIADKMLYAAKHNGKNCIKFIS